jgi:hypothetical protein
MISSYMMEEELKKTPRFNGVKCNESYSDPENGFIGYRLEGLYGRDGASPVRAGLIIVDGGITGVFYSVADRVYKVGFTEVKFLDEIRFVMKTLHECLSDDRDVGNRFWVQRRSEPVTKARICSRDSVINPVVGERLVFIRPVLVDFGFEKVFCELVFGSSQGEYVASLSERKGDLLRSAYEACFTSKKEGNRFYMDVKDNSFISKKGNKIYNLDSRSFLELFRRVRGEWFLCG